MTVLIDRVGRVVYVVKPERKVDHRWDLAYIVEHLGGHRVRAAHSEGEPYGRSTSSDPGDQLRLIQVVTLG